VKSRTVTFDAKTKKLSCYPARKVKVLEKSLCIHWSPSKDDIPGMEGDPKQVNSSSDDASCLSATSPVLGGILPEG
jgi:hypothetical protein